MRLPGRAAHLVGLDDDASASPTLKAVLVKKVGNVDDGEGESKGEGYALEGVHWDLGAGVKRWEPGLVHHKAKHAGDEHQKREAVHEALGSRLLAREVHPDADDHGEKDQAEAEDH